MKYIDKKVAYIQGLVEGLELDTTTKEGKVIEQILDVLGDISDALGGLTEAHEELKEYVSVMDEDLDELENVVIDMELNSDDDNGDYLKDDNDFYEVICPKCKKVYLTDFESFESDSVICPECGEPFHLDERVVDELTPDEGCQCGHHHE